MSNTLTDLIPTIYEALDVISREMVGFIPAVSRNASAERASLNQTIRARVVPALAAADITPSGTLPDPAGISYGKTDCSISKSRCVRVPWDQEEIKSVDDQAGYNRDAFAQAFRTLSNEVEADLAGLYKYASRAYGTAGTTPFGTAGDLSDLGFTRQILEDNGAPKSDLQMVLSSAAIATLRSKQGVVFKANEAGGTEGQKTGNVTMLEGFAINSSGQVVSHTKGTGASYQLSAAKAVGSTSISVDTGSGTILAGDVFTNSQSGRDANKYIVNTALAAGVLVLNQPGIRVAWVDDDTVAVGNSYKANMAFSKSAILLLARVPQRPEKDAALDVTTVMDPVSGITFEISVYGGYRKIWYEVALCWGVKAVKSEHIAILLG